MFETSISHNNVPVIRIDGKIIGGAANALKREMDKQIEQSRGSLGPRHGEGSAVRQYRARDNYRDPAVPQEDG